MTNDLTAWRALAGEAKAAGDVWNASTPCPVGNRFLAASAALRAACDRIEAERARTLDENTALRAARDRIEALWPLARLGLAALEASRDGDSFDGGEVQEIAESVGAVVLIPVGPDTYCGEGCRCAECEADACYRDSPGTAMVRRLLAARPAPTPPEGA